MGVVSRQKARKQYKCGAYGCGKTIEKGEEYYRIKKKFQAPRFRCLEHRPKPSELATSDKIARLLAIQEGLAEIKLETASHIEDVQNTLEEQADEADGVGEDYNQSADNMEEYFPNSSQVDEIREKAEACEAWAEELRNASSELEDHITEVRELEQEKDKLQEQETELLQRGEEADEEELSSVQDRIEEIDSTIQSKLDEARETIDNASDSLNI